MASPAFKERFVRMLVSKLRVVFETASRDIELWHQSASAQMEAQLRDRRRSFRKRRESLERIQQAAGELEERVADVESATARVEALMQDVTLRCETVAVLARRGPTMESEHFDLPMDAAAAV
jgi:vacuolar-type H+-ATPase subunit E/Vma4